MLTFHLFNTTSQIRISHNYIFSLGLSLSVIKIDLLMVIICEKSELDVSHFIGAATWGSILKYVKL